MTVLSEDLLRGTAVALAGGVTNPVRGMLVGAGADLQALDPSWDEERAEAWARSRAPLRALVFDGRSVFGNGGPEALRLVLERAWIAVRAIAAGALIPAREGKIVLLGPAPRDGAHAGAARKGLENLARTLSVEWARYGVTIVAVMPGERTSDPELGELVCFLVSAAGDYFSGCLLDLGSVSQAARR